MASRRRIASSDPDALSQRVLSQLSLRQRAEALGLANEVRQQRAQLKRDLKEGCRSIVVVVLEPPTAAGSEARFLRIPRLPRAGGS
jgi:hypothetical protein